LRLQGNQIIIDTRSEEESETKGRRLSDNGAQDTDTPEEDDEDDEDKEGEEEEEEGEQEGIFELVTEVKTDQGSELVEISEDKKIILEPNAVLDYVLNKMEANNNARYTQWLADGEMRTGCHTWLRPEVHELFNKPGKQPSVDE